jgi:hypothetical protein
MKVINRFMSDLEATLGIERTEISLSQAWSSTPPTTAGSETLEDFLDKVCRSITALLNLILSQAGWEPVFYDAYHNLGDFRQDYESKFAKKPYVTPYNR